MLWLNILPKSAPYVAEIAGCYQCTEDKLLIRYSELVSSSKEI